MVDAIFSASVCPSCLEFAPIGVACVRCDELGVSNDSRRRTYRSPWYLAGMRASSALRARTAQWVVAAEGAPDTVAASAEGWARLRGRVRAMDGSPVAVLERLRVGGESVVTADVADFQLVDGTGRVLVASHARAVELIAAELPQGRWRREIRHGDEVVLVAHVAMVGDGPHRSAPCQVVSSVQRPALLFMDVE